MIDKREILAVSQQTSLRPHVVEKDYVLGWMLAGIYRHKDLAENWVFKGGTCLKKCFFETYRFSEDLDFTLLKPEHLDAAFLKSVFSKVGEWARIRDLSEPARPARVPGEDQLQRAGLTDSPSSHQT